ncbi:MAG: glycosyltransferase family 4 protein [Cytophagales bacterium]|nr:glycosyltransferase family 4 protein [Rhizobacter sp.]
MIHYVTQNGIGNAWVANELSRVEGAGLPVALHAMRAPEKLLHDSTWAVEMNRRTELMYPLPWLAMFFSLLAAPFRFRGRFSAALWNAFFGRREHIRARLAGIAHLVVACHWATGLLRSGRPVSQIHSQWINSCGTIAMYGAWLLDAPFSFTGHATDLFRNRCALLDKIERANFIICISTFHRDFYLENGARPEQLVIAYCGIDLSWFHPPAAGSHDTKRLYRIVSSGRLVEKKGFDDLIRACKLLADKGERFECVIGGSGPLEDELKAQIRSLGLASRVTVTGKALLQEKIIDFMHGGDVYVLPCVWAADGDVDGLPQMIMEAMACGLPAISTRLVGIPDLIQHEDTGLLVEPKSPAQLADAMARLMHDAALAARLSENGQRLLKQTFDLNNCLEPLIEKFRQSLAKTAPGRRAIGAQAQQSRVSP